MPYYPANAATALAAKKAHGGTNPAAKATSTAATWTASPTHSSGSPGADSRDHFTP